MSVPAPTGRDPNVQQPRRAAPRPPSRLPGGQVVVVRPGSLPPIIAPFGAPAAPPAPPINPAQLAQANAQQPREVVGPPVPPLPVPAQQARLAPLPGRVQGVVHPALRQLPGGPPPGRQQEREPVGHKKV